MKTSIKVSILALSLLGIGQGAQASVLNGSFESGDLAGWDNVGNTSVVSSFDTYTPTDGNYFALLTAGLGEGVYSTISQEFHASATDVLSFNTFFKAGDYMPYNDNGYVRLLDQNKFVVTDLFTKSVSDVGDYGQTAWTGVSYSFTSTGDYRIQFGVTNIGDNVLHSSLGVDSISVSPVPEPDEWAMMILGLGLVGVQLLRKNNVQDTEVMYG